MGLPSTSRVGLIGLTAFLAVCGGDSSPTAVTPSPSPSPTATPPLAPPTPEPTPSCSLGFGDPTGRCRVTSPAFLADVDAAVEKVIREKPEIFNLNDARGDGGYKVLSTGQFYVALLANLRAAGFCADFDGEEVPVKNSQEFHEQYQLILSSIHLRRGPSMYRASCYPAGFPLPQPPPPPVPGCALAPSREITCGKEPSLYEADVDAAINQVFREHPEYFNLSDRTSANWPKILNIQGYEAGVVANLQQRGYCAVAHAELGVKKENRFSESYDIVSSGLYARHGPGTYQSSCYPAAF